MAEHMLPRLSEVNLSTKNRLPSLLVNPGDMESFGRDGDSVLLDSNSCSTSCIHS